MQVVEDEHERFVDGAGGQPGAHGVEEAVALGLGVGADRKRQARDPLAQLRHQPGQLPAIATQTARQSRGVVDEVAERLHERLVRHSQVLIAAPSQHHGAFVIDLLGQFGGQAGLAHPRLAGHQRNPQPARGRFLP